MKINTSNITGVVLAGGKSSRMKTDKALIKYQNITLLEHQINLLKTVFDKVIISANTQEYSFTGTAIINDDEKSKGPIGGILSALKNTETEYIFILSVDMPFINKDLIQELIKDVSTYDIAIPVYNGKYEPTCAVYSKKCISIIETQIRSKNNKLIDFINICNAKFIDINSNSELYSDKIFTNLNTPEELKALQ